MTQSRSIGVVSRVDDPFPETLLSVAGPDPAGSEEPESRTSDPFSHLFQRRTVWLRTTLDQDAANRLSAELLALDSTSESPIELVINSPGGPLDTALSVIDTLDLLRSPVATLCLGQAMGTAAAVLACGSDRRRATPAARLSLRLRPFDASGTATELQNQARQLTGLHDHLALRLAEATGQLPAVIVMNLEQGGFMTAEQAVGYGLIDEVAERR
jgi:ATP-dependent Clp protease protease subunit